MSLNVTIVEPPALFGQPELQLKRIATILNLAPVGDVIVLPETTLTGYVSSEGVFDLSSFGEPFEGAQLAGLRALALERRAAVIGPVIERDGARLFNTQVVLAADGSVLAKYRKRHPWYPETWATPGDLPFPRFRLGDLECTLAICFDVHFLAQEAMHELGDSDVLFFCSAWVDDEVDSRPGHLTPLARDFGLAVVNANWGRGDPRLPGQGGSMVIDRTGAILCRATERHRRLDVRID